MAFHSFKFFVFLTALIFAFHLSGERFRPPLLLVASYLFYAYVHPPHLVLLIGVTLLTFVGSLLLDRNRSGSRLSVFICLILLPLIVFKYYDFSVELVNETTPAQLGFLDLALPIGISFYVFQAISYVVEVYRGTTIPRRKVGEVALYLAFFPQILAGPIERPNKLFPQLERLSSASFKTTYFGFKYILWGFFCKLVVADNVGLIVDRILAGPENESGGSLAIAFGLYSFQIYFDFLGYTGMAIGIACLFGVRLSPNFNRPYLATSLREFWRRWHISLSTWFRDYIYVPLGGKSTRSSKRVFQILAVFLISGLWHGAALNFLAWGLFHGFAYLCEDSFRKRFSTGSKPLPPLRLPFKALRIAVTFLVVTMAWALFRLQEFSSIGVVFDRVFYLDRGVFYSSLNSVLFEPHTLITLVILFLAFSLDSSKVVLSMVNKIPETSREIMAEVALVNLFLLTLLIFGDYGVRDFIYYRF